jgi:hypothetical protein
LELDFKIKTVNLSSIMDEPQTLISQFVAKKYMDYALLYLIDKSPKISACIYIYIYIYQLYFRIKDEFNAFKFPNIHITYEKINFEMQTFV